jgi:hypothetical protein
MRRRWCALKPCRPRCGSNRADPPRLVRLRGFPSRGEACGCSLQDFRPTKGDLGVSFRILLVVERGVFESACCESIWKALRSRLPRWDSPRKSAHRGEGVKKQRINPVHSLSSSRKICPSGARQVGRTARGNQTGAPGARLAGIIASNGARLTMVYFRPDRAFPLLAVFWFVRGFLVCPCKHHHLHQCLPAQPKAAPQVGPHRTVTSIRDNVVALLGRIRA